MSEFEEVLDGVRLTLTQASPAGIQALLEGLVEEQIISEAYSRSLNVQRLAEGIAPEPLFDKTACIQESNLTSSRCATHRHLNQSQLNQVRKCASSEFCEFPATDQNLTRPKPVSAMDERNGSISGPKIHPLYDEGLQSCLRSDDEMIELLRGAEPVHKPLSDNERVSEGNLEGEKEWLEQVEEAARRIAVPLWQHWDRGRRMLLPLVPSNNTDCLSNENAAVDRDAQCPVLNMEEETDLAIAFRTLDLFALNFDCTKADITDPSFTLGAEGAAGVPQGLGFSTYDSLASTGWNTDHFEVFEAARNASPVQAYAATDTNNNITDFCGVTGRTADITGDSLCLTGDMQCGTDAGFTEDFAHLYSPCIPKDTHTGAQENSFCSNTDQSMTLGVLHDTEDVFRTGYIAKTDFHENKEDKDSDWGTKMQEVDQDPFFTLDLGDLPEDLSEFLNEETLDTIDVDVLFGDPWLNSGTGGGSDSDILMPLELPGKGSQQQKHKLPDLQPPQSVEENTSSKPKRRKKPGQPKIVEAPAEPAVTQVETEGLPVTPPRILQLHPSIQFITIPDNPQYQLIQTVRLTPPVITLPLPNTAATPTYILVPATSPPSKCQGPPLSPVDGAVAPIQMSSSPPGSLSDTASKAMSPPCALPQSPSNEVSTCKEPPIPQSPTVLDIPQVVKDYIQEAKAHMSKTCQDMEAGLSLTSHYVEVQLSQREIFRSGKNTNKFLEKELIIIGDTDRQKSLLVRNQIFEGSKEGKPKRYILLLGHAGMGKTTLIKKLCLDWADDCIPQFDFVFFLDGKALALTEPTFSLQTLLLNLSSCAPACIDPEEVYAQILAVPKRVLIIFDGFDELRTYEILLQTQEKDLTTSLQRDSKAQTYTVRQLYSAILQRVLLPGCTLLLSTRPRGTASQLLRRTDSLLEVCGFSPTDLEAYLSQYFTDLDLRESALDSLKNCSYLRLLCWNPGLCRLVCLVLEQSKGSAVLPRTLTGLCHQVWRLKVENDSASMHSQAEDQTQISVESVDEEQAQISSSSQLMRCQNNTRSRAQAGTRNQRRSRRKIKEQDETNGEVMKSAGRVEESEFLSELCSLAWEGVKANSSSLPKGRTISAKLKAFGHRTELFLSYHLRTKQAVSSGERDGGDMGETRGNGTGTADASDDHILFWANPFLQSYLAGVHLSLSRTVSDRSFLQNLPFPSGPKGRRRPQREEFELTQRFAVGLLFHSTTELQRLHSYTETVFRDMVVSKQALVTKHLEGLSHGDLRPAQVLEACHYVYEASSTHEDASSHSRSLQLVAHLAENLPEVLTFRGVPLNPSDVFAVQNILERGGTAGRRFCLDLEDSAIQISGLRALVGLDNIKTYRACIADAITLWERLQQSGEEGLLQGAVSKFKIHPLKATQVCHIEHLAKLVNMHIHKRLSDSSSQSDSILAEGVPAVKDLHKLEFELGPEDGPLALPKLWELLPGLQNLQHLDLENSKIGDTGAEKLANALVPLRFLEILNLSQNCIGDQGVKKLAATLRVLPKLHCLSLYSNVISDEGAESLAAVLPHVASLIDLDVKYNKLTDVGAQSLGVSLKSCKRMKTLRMWNQCIPYGVFERLQRQDNRILWH